MDYSGAYASHQTMYAPNFGNLPTEQLQQQHYQQHYKTLPQASLTEQSRNPYATAVTQHQIACDIKPRLTKEQHDILEAHYTDQAKPNTSTKKGFAESLNVSLDKVNVSYLWRVSHGCVEANVCTELVSEPQGEIETRREESPECDTGNEQLPAEPFPPQLKRLRFRTLSSLCIVRLQQHDATI